MYFPDKPYEYKYSIYNKILDLSFDLSFDEATDDTVNRLGTDSIRNHMIERSNRPRAPLQGGLYLLNKKMYGGLN